MKYANYIKEAVIIVVIITLSARSVDNVRTIKDLEISLEQTKNNLYQTNQVIAEMQKKYMKQLLPQNNYVRYQP